MKFTLCWLKDHLDTTATLHEIGEALTALGLEVEDITDQAALYAPFKTVHVKEAKRHPNADKLQVCMVDTGEEIIQVVCGAPNARAGMKAVFAPVGSYIPGLDFELKKGNIRGEDSFGMLVSEKEMLLSEESEGIIELPESTDIGTPLSTLFGLDDPVIEIALTPNRPDCAGVRGIARDLAAAGLGTLKPLEKQEHKGAFDSPINVHLDFDEAHKSACPLFLGCTIKNVKNGPSPEWLQKRLKAIGLRPISALVDITNYISYDLCRPLHVFDADKLTGDIHVRLGKKGEKLEALDEKTYELDDFMTVVADEKGPVGLGGVMGGEDTGCTEKTTNVFLEVAYFDPARTAKTGRALQIVSDARYRFERGIDPAFTIDAATIAINMVLEICGGEASHVVKAGNVPDTQKAFLHNPARVEQLTGLDVNADRQKQILQSLGFTVKADAKGWHVTAPSWRPDIEGSADFVEEIIRVIGLNEISPVSLEPLSPLTSPAETPMQGKSRMARSLLATRGLNETVTWSFMPSDKAAKFRPAEIKNAHGLQLKNPISNDLDHMRPSILPNLIDAAGRNAARGFTGAALFEVGPVFYSTKPNGQKQVAAGIRTAQDGPRHWSSKDTNRNVDVFDAKADALETLRACGAPADNAQITRDAPAWYHPGRSGSFRLGKNILAHFGELHPGLLEEMGIDGPVAAFEVYLDNIPASRKKSGETAKKPIILSAFQPIQRDFAFLMDKDIEAGAILRAVKKAEKALLADAEIFDIYDGKGIAEGKKSVALTITLQPYEKTLTDDEIERISQAIIETVKKETGGTLRG